MKTTISLGIFVIILILSCLCSFALKSKFIEKKINRNSVKQYFMSKISEGLDEKNYFSKFRFTQNKSKNKVGDNIDATLAILPNFNNRGFKCMEYTPKRPDYSEMCSNLDQSCASKGVILFGPDDNENFVYILKKAGESVTCSLSVFGLSSSTRILGQRCYTGEVSNRIEVKKEYPVPINHLSHRICVHSNAPLNFKFVKQSEIIECKIKTFDPTGKQEGDCFCVNINLPQIAKPLKPVYYPIRANKNGFQCIKSIDKTCEAYSSRKNCFGAVQGNLDPIKFDTADVILNNTAINYFFNQWICPNQSGLRYAVKYTLSGDKKGYSISCLGRTGDDCFYDNNAAEACKRINNCTSSSSEFGSLTCGTEAFKSKWFHDGFSTPLKTWCKEANGWLRFNGEINLASDKSNATILLGEGILGCIPDPNDGNKCLAENESKFLQKTIDFYSANPSNFNNLLICDISTFPDSVTNNNHWCNKQTYAFSNSGIFNFDISSLQIK